MTMDDATNEHYAIVMVDEERTASSLLGVQAVIKRRRLFSSFYSDRGNHYWTVPEVGGKVDHEHSTQFGCAMKQLGIEIIAAYSPEARGRSERAFGTHQGRLPPELALAGITIMAAANPYLAEVYLPAFNAEFMHPAREECSALVPWIGATSPTSCASSSSGPWATTIACASRARPSSYRKPNIDAISSRSRCACIATSMATWRCFTDRVGSLTTPETDHSLPTT